MGFKIVTTEKAPSAIGTYSQAVVAGKWVFLSGQIPLLPGKMELVTGDIAAEIDQVFKNLESVAQAAGGRLQQVVKVNIYLTDLAHFTIVNEVMGRYFKQPYPARAAVQVAALPKGARVEADAILVLD